MVEQIYLYYSLIEEIRCKWNIVFYNIIYNIFPKFIIYIIIFS